MNEGWKAMTDDGEFFTCNWDVFPDESMNPTFHWYSVERDSDDGPWTPVDACQAVNMGMDVHVTPEGEPAIPVGATLCEKHNQVYLEGDDCFECAMRKLRRNSHS